MPKVTWMFEDGGEVFADVKDGLSLMDAAVHNGVRGVIGECGGGLMCATCHVYVDPAFAHLTGEASAMESDLLDMTEVPRRPESRLSCQLVASEVLDGLVLRVPSA
ncbi:MAG: (2Fe-2S)-binding protein [Comamonadaceae bacterium]|uniref:2Fe-2S iron-sulfur cluster-binding protein n=1 Tax=Candidatus Skiveiella danica TaxID=3386177 RepID=UPI001B6E80EE|nr:(2Fe-2S)-binding protein [Comamonadaceae bacterium]MBK9200259.1 (2Fe-2S)-binding protein [Betaproteobacteria bacterium]MBP6502443.1 (2Fe-2S)-binding protein [Rhodoferax sp.]MBK6556954.1 (2Fe-2S)-binding protein [Comamonadaceae bacterium]MBK6926499.1 (2Fe-2S)-binding protein [Comamonadaceae bacterium]